MKNNRSILPIFLFCILAGTVFAQTGVFWFGDSTSNYVNNRIISMKEKPGGGLYFLGKASDRQYANVHPYWGSCDKSGKLIVQKTLETTNDIFELNNFVVCSENKFRIWGTETVNNRQTLLLNTIDAKGNLPGSDAILTNTNTLCGDVLQADAQTAVCAKTVQSSSTGLFHISIYKYNLENDQQIWYKKLDAEGNEEASKLFLMKDGSVILLAKEYDERLTTYTSLIYKLSSTGELIWRKSIAAYPIFFAHGIAEGKNKSLVYVCSIGSERDTVCSTKICSLDSSGNLLSTNEVPGIRANGILGLKNGNFFLYGSHFQKASVYIITKACFKIYDPNLKLLKTDELGMFDGPDAQLPSLAMSVWPTSSDFLTAIQLSDGRIACGGRVYMPTEKDPEKIIFSDRVNKGLLVLMSSDGKFR